MENEAGRLSQTRSSKFNGRKRYVAQSTAQSRAPARNRLHAGSTKSVPMGRWTKGKMEGSPLFHFHSGVCKHSLYMSFSILARADLV
jgi:hypothetical protein